MQSLPSIVKIKDLEEIEAEIFPQVFHKSLGVIFQYSLHDVKEILNRLDNVTLMATSSLLSKDIISLFPELSSKRPIRRNAKHKMVSDICNLGTCIINKLKNRDLDKFFVDQSSQTPDSIVEHSDVPEIISDLLQNVSMLSEKVKNLEREIKLLKEKESVICGQEPIEENSGEPHQQLPLPLPPSSPLPATLALVASQDSERSRVIDGGHPNCQISSLHSALPTRNSYALLNDECEEDSDTEMEEGREEGEENACRGHQLRGNNAVVRERREKSSPVESGGNRPLRAGVDTKSQEMTQVFIGGVAKTASENDVVEELTYRGIPQTDISVRLHRQNNYKKSFVATVPVAMKNRLLNHRQWSEGIIVRPFLQQKRKNLQAAQATTTTTTQRRKSTPRTFHRIGSGRFNNGYRAFGNVPRDTHPTHSHSSGSFHRQRFYNPHHEYPHISGRNGNAWRGNPPQLYATSWGYTEDHPPRLQSRDPRWYRPRAYEEEYPPLHTRCYQYGCR